MRTPGCVARPAAAAARSGASAAQPLVLKLSACCRRLALLSPCAALQVEEWAQCIQAWAQTYGVSDSVMLLEDLSSGDDVRGTGASPMEAPRAQGATQAVAGASWWAAPCLTQTTALVLPARRAAGPAPRGAAGGAQAAGGAGQSQVRAAPRLGAASLPQEKQAFRHFFMVGVERGRGTHGCLGPHQVARLPASRSQRTPVASLPLAGCSEARCPKRRA